MKTILIIMFIYIVGYVLSYILGRMCYKNLNEGVWTKGNRKTWLKRSFLSFFSVLASLIYIFTYMLPNNKDDNTPASW